MTDSRGVHIRAAVVAVVIFVAIAALSGFGLGWPEVLIALAAAGVGALLVERAPTMRRDVTGANPGNDEQ